MSHRHLLIPAALIGVLAMPVHAGSRGPSTPEERDHMVKLAVEAGKDPLGAYAREGRSFDKWLDEIPDINFGPAAPAIWCEGASKGDLRKVMRFEYELGGVAYQIQHQIADPKTLDERLAVHQAALESVLRAYESLLPLNPGNRSDKMDQAIVLRNKGELPAFVKSLFAGKR